MFLLDLPHELIETILVACDPTEVAQAAQTCRLIRDIVYNNTADTALWRELYLVQFDDPRRCILQDGGHRGHVDWKRELQSIIRARTLIHAMSIGRPNEIGPALQTLLNMICCVPPLKARDDLSGLSRNIVWAFASLRCGWLDFLAQQRLHDEDRQRLARLHTHYGMTQEDVKKQSLVKSRAYVYDMRNYRWDNEFGPYTDDGRVNWVHIRAIHHIVSMHIVDIPEEEGDDDEYEYAIYPMSMPFTQICLPKVADVNGQDWAGVSGSWTVSFCFCDHRELLLYNESNDSPSSPLDPSIFEADEFQEVFRSLNVEIRMKSTEYNPDHPTKPTIFFFGEMKDVATSTMTGRVKMTADNQVQWHFVSGEQGNAIWSSEGVQVGGLRSAFGVLGSWTTIFHDADDPVGPFWLRRQSNPKH